MMITMTMIAIVFVFFSFFVVSGYNTAKTNLFDSGYTTINTRMKKKLWFDKHNCVRENKMNNKQNNNTKPPTVFIFILFLFLVT